jgi:hypothetical protein
MKLGYPTGKIATEEGGGSNKGARPQYSSSNVSERETHFDCDLQIRKWRVPHPVHCDIA